MMKHVCTVVCGDLCSYVMCNCVCVLMQSKNVGTGSTGSPPLWLEPFQEQVVLLNWPVFSAKTISLAVPKEMHNKLGGTQHSHSDEGDGFDADAPELSTARKPTASIAYTQPHTEEEEGPIFFDGQVYVALNTTVLALTFILVSLLQ